MKSGVYRLQGVAINDKHIAGDRPPDAEVEIDETGETELIRASRSTRSSSTSQCRVQAEGRKGNHRPPGAAQHHQSLAADPLVHLGGVVPGDHARAHEAAVNGKVDTLEGLKRTSSSPPDTGGTAPCERAARGRRQARRPHLRNARRRAAAAKAAAEPSRRSYRQRVVSRHSVATSGPLRAALFHNPTDLRASPRCGQERS